MTNTKNHDRHPKGHCTCGYKLYRREILDYKNKKKQDIIEEFK